MVFVFIFKIFMKEQTVDVDMIRCLQRLCQKNVIIKTYTFPDLQLVETLKETLKMFHTMTIFSPMIQMEFCTSSVLMIGTRYNRRLRFIPFKTAYIVKALQSFRRIEKRGYEEIWTHR